MAALGPTGLVVALFAACLGGSPVLGVDGEKLPSDSGVLAYLGDVWSSFPWVDGLGNVGIGQSIQMTYDASRQRLLMADDGRDELLVLDDDFEVQSIVSGLDTATIAAPWLIDCNDVAVDSRGQVYLADLGNETVWILDKNLSLVGVVPIPPHTRSGFPVCVAVDSMDRVIVGDWRTSGHSRILVYTEGNESGWLDLEASFQFNPPDEPAYCGVPFDIAVDSQDHIIIAESSTPFYAVERVHVFDKEFGWVTSFGSHGSEPGQFAHIDSIAIGPDDTVVVSDRSHWSTVSFYFNNGTYAGRVSGFSQPTGLLVKRGMLLVGDSEGLKKVDVDWASLGSQAPEPEPKPVPENMVAACVLLFKIHAGALVHRVLRQATYRGSSSRMVMMM